MYISKKNVLSKTIIKYIKSKKVLFKLNYFDKQFVT